MNVLVLNTTETDSIAAATRANIVRKSQPHRIFNPKSGEMADIVGWDEEGRRPPIPRTKGRVVWLDIVGWADRLPAVDTEWWDNLARIVEMTCEEADIDIQFPRSFGPFRDRHGPHVDRLTADQWDTIGGIIGTQHLPGVGNGEPGDLSRLVEIMMDQAGPEASPIYRIQAALHRAGLYDGPLDGKPNFELVEAVETMETKIEHSDAMTVAQRGQIDTLSAEIDRINAEHTMAIEFWEAQQAEAVNTDQAGHLLTELTRVLWGDTTARRVTEALTTEATT